MVGPVQLRTPRLRIGQFHNSLKGLLPDRNLPYFKGLAKPTEDGRGLAFGTPRAASMKTVLWDLRFGLRTMARTPGFTAVAVLTLALGIGANTAILSVVNSVLPAPLPYPDASSLVSVCQKTADGGYNAFSTPNFLAWRDQTKAFEEFAAMRPAAFNLGGSHKPESILGANVSAGIFRLFRVSPILGRTFLAGDDQLSGSHVIVGWGRAAGEELRAPQSC